MRKFGSCGFFLISVISSAFVPCLSTRLYSPVLQIYHQFPTGYGFSNSAARSYPALTKSRPKFETDVTSFPNIFPKLQCLRINLWFRARTPVSIPATPMDPPPPNGRPRSIGTGHPEVCLWLVRRAGTPFRHTQGQERKSSRRSLPYAHARQPKIAYERGGTWRYSSRE